MTGLLQKILVYEHGKPIGEAALIGTGWVEIYPNGRSSAPNLYDLKGIRLPQGWYQLAPQDDFRFVVLPVNKKVVQ